MKIIEKLSTYAALLGVIGAIGGDFTHGASLIQGLMQLKVHLQLI